MKQIFEVTQNKADGSAYKITKVALDQTNPSLPKLEVTTTPSGFTDFVDDFMSTLDVRVESTHDASITCEGILAENTLCFSGNLIECLKKLEEGGYISEEVKGRVLGVLQPPQKQLPLTIAPQHMVFGASIPSSSPSGASSSQSGSPPSDDCLAALTNALTQFKETAVPILKLLFPSPGAAESLAGNMVQAALAPVKERLEGNEAKTAPPSTPKKTG